MPKKRKKGRGLASRRSFASTGLKARVLHGPPGQRVSLRKSVKKRVRGRVLKGKDFTVSKPGLVEITNPAKQKRVAQKTRTTRLLKSLRR